MELTKLDKYDRSRLLDKIELAIRISQPMSSAEIEREIWIILNAKAQLDMTIEEISRREK